MIKTTKSSIRENHAKLPDTYFTNKTDVYYIDDTWRMKFVDLNDFRSKKTKVTDVFK